MMTCLMFVIGGYAAGRNADFYSSFNLNSLLGSSGALPLALVAMGQVTPSWWAASTCLSGR